MTLSDNKLSIGGLFNKLGPATGHAALLNSETGIPDFSFPKVQKNVYTIAPDSSGGCYIGGYFTEINGVARNRIAHIKADRTLDLDWNPDADGVVRGIVVSGSIVYVFGEFSNIGGRERRYIAALNASDGKATDWHPNPNNNSFIEAIAVSQNTVYVGGEFSSIGDSSRKNIAAIDAVTGKAESWNPDPNGIIYSVIISDSIIYTGGNFTSIGGVSRNYIASLSKSTGKAKDWDPYANNRITCMALSDSVIYVTGSFDSIGGASRNRVAAVDLVTGKATGFQTVMYGIRTVSITSMAATDSSVYVAGNFTYIGGEARSLIAELKAATGQATSWNPGLIGGNSAMDFFPAAYTIAVSGKDVYAGGFFLGINEIYRNNIAAFDVLTGKPTTWDPGVSGPVFSLAASNSIVYAGGDFGGTDGKARNSLAAFYALSGKISSWDPNIDSPYPFVMTIEAVDSLVFIGGNFQSINGTKRKNLAAINKSTGKLSDFNPYVNRTVRNILPAGSEIYIAGDFDSVDNISRKKIAAFDAATGELKDWKLDIDGNVEDIGVSDSILFLGGEFSSVNKAARNNLCAINRLTGKVMDWNPDVNGTVYCIEVSGSTVYIGGSFTTINGQPVKYLAAIDAYSGSVINLAPGLNGSTLNFVVDEANKRIYLYGGGLGITSIDLNQVEVRDREVNPKEFLLSQNYPNPFNPVTVIGYRLSVTSHATLKVYDILGREVATLVNEEKAAGTYTVKFDASSLSTGVYFYRISAGKFSAVKKLIYLK